MLEPGLRANKFQKLIVYVLSLILVGFVFHFVYVRIASNQIGEKGDKLLGKIENVEKQ